MIDPNSPNYRPKDPRIPALGLVFAAALLIGYACFSHRWLENTNFRDAHIGFSLLSLETCLGDDCTSKSNFELISEAKSRGSENASGLFAPAGVVTLVLLGVAVVGLLASVAVGYTRKQKTAPATVALLGIVAGLLTGCLFIATKPGGIGAVGVGPGFWAFGLGAVLGIIGAQMLKKLAKPAQADLYSA